VAGDTRVTRTVWREDKSACVLIASSHAWCDFAIVEVQGVDDKGNMLFQGEHRSHEEGLTPETAVPLVRGYIKWDGCTEATTNPHLCDGPKSILEFCALWVWALNQCHAAMVEAGGNDPHVEWDPLEQ
jgi:hypothetical protein